MTTPYETVCVIKPDATPAQLDKITDKIKKVLADHKIDTLNKQEWGIRKLAYPIQNFKTAHYLYYTFSGGNTLISELERQLSYDDSVLRYLTMKVAKNGRTDVKPEPYQFAKMESESYSHPFGGGGFERRDRYDNNRRGFERRDHNEEGN